VNPEIPGTWFVKAMASAGADSSPVFINSNQRNEGDQYGGEDAVF
jgi:hypothetical protein